MNENEMDGINIAKSVQKTASCAHEYVEKIEERMNFAGKIEKISTKTCKKCKNWIRVKL